MAAAGQLLSLPDGVSLLGAALLRLGDRAGAARLLAAGDAWRQARGMAIVGLLAERTIIGRDRGSRRAAADARDRGGRELRADGAVRLARRPAAAGPVAGYPTDAATARPTVRPEKMQPPRKVPSSAR